MRRANYPGYTLFFLILVSLNGFVFGQEESTATIQKEHKGFYRAKSEIDLNAVLRLNDHQIQKVLSVTLDYNMAFSSLDAQCLSDEIVVHETSLPRGLGKKFTCEYDVEYPGKLALRLLGDRGQIQVTAVEARVITKKPRQDGGQAEFQSDSSSAAGHAELGGVVALERNTQELRQAKHFEILAPSGWDNWELGKVTNLYWKSTGIGGDLALELFKDRDRVALISRKTPVNKGTYQWTVSGEDIVPGGGYQVRMTTLVDTESYVSEAFGILEDYVPATIKQYSPVLQTMELKKQDAVTPISLQVLSPKHQDQWNVLQDYTIKWESEGLSRDDDIGIAIKPASRQLAKIIGIVKNTGEFTYHVPYPLIFMGYDIQVIITPLKDRSIEVLSDPFVIHRPRVDMIANNPSISYKLPQRPPRKWWQVIGDIFTGGISWYVREVVELSQFSAEGTTMQVDVNVMNKGYLTRNDVMVDCSIQTLWGSVLYSFEPQYVEAVATDVAEPVSFSAKTKGMKLEAGTYKLEIFIDPDGNAGEDDAFRANNRVMVEFEVE